MSTVNVSLSGGLAAVAGTRRIEIEAATLSQVLEALSSTFGGEFRKRLYDVSGKPRRFINIYVNGRDHRFLKRLDTELAANDTVSLIPAVSGG